jgi:L-ribulose-5-phosphate 3-epimerase
MTRRSLIHTVPAALAAASASGRLPIRKGVLLSMLPAEMPYVDRFQLARDVGFEQIELPTIENEDEAVELKKASEASGLVIHSVMNQAHWKFPLSSADPAVVAESVKGMQASLRNAHLWGAGTVLLVPAVVNPQTSYRDAWKRSKEQIQRLIPLAQELKVIIAVEEVWNKFLLSPLEFAAYVDEFQSPWVKAYFDIGNHVKYVAPEQWILTLGKLVAKCHVKDFKLNQSDPNGGGQFVDIRDGSIRWPVVRTALDDVGYDGWMTIEGGNLSLQEHSQRLDLILAGK